MPSRRVAALLLACAAGATAAGPWSPGQAPPPAPWAVPAAPRTPADEQARRERLALAEALLAAGRAADAHAAFDLAGREEHAADIELGMLRSQMQQGQYRAALAFAAHTARAHPDVAAGAALYAALLHVGGQPAIALQTLERAQQRQPGDPALARARAVLCEGGRGPACPVPPPDDAAAPPGAPAPHERLAPYATGAAVPPTASVVANALLLAGGRQAIVPLEALVSDGAGARPALWLRNGLGLTVRARVDRADESAGLALLELETALPDPGTPLAAEDASPGRPAYAFGYVAAPAGEGAWPRMGLGFLGRRLPGGGQLLDLAVPGGLPGAPLVDPGGRVVGLGVSADAPGRARMVGAAALRALGGRVSAAPPQAPSAAAEPVAAAAATRAPDELYERALVAVLQVIALRR